VCVHDDLLLFIVFVLYKIAKGKQAKIFYGLDVFRWLHAIVASPISVSSSRSRSASSKYKLMIEHDRARPVCCWEKIRYHGCIQHKIYSQKFSSWDDLIVWLFHQEEC